MSSDPPPPRRLLEQWIQKRLGESNAAQFMLFQPSPGSPELRDGKLVHSCTLRFHPRVTAIYPNLEGAFMGEGRCSKDAEHSAASRALTKQGWKRPVDDPDASAGKRRKDGNWPSTSHPTT